MAMTILQHDAPVLDRLVTVRSADPGYYDRNGDWHEQTRDEIMWAARVDLKVDAQPTDSGVVEVGGAVYLIRWIDVSFIKVADGNRPIIVGLRDDVGFRNIIGVENVTGYRGRYLEIHCAGTR